MLHLRGGLRAKALQRKQNGVLSLFRLVNTTRQQHKDKAGLIGWNEKGGRHKSEAWSIYLTIWLGQDWQPTNHCCTCFTWLSNEWGSASTPVCSSSCCRSPPSPFRPYTVQMPPVISGLLIDLTLKRQNWLNDSGPLRSLLSKVLKYMYVCVSHICSGPQLLDDHLYPVYHLLPHSCFLWPGRHEVVEVYHLLVEPMGRGDWQKRVMC